MYYTGTNTTIATAFVSYLDKIIGTINTATIIHTNGYYYYYRTATTTITDLFVLSIILCFHPLKSSYCAFISYNSTTKISAPTLSSIDHAATF